MNFTHDRMIVLTLVQLEVLCAVVETGSFTKAGALLGLTQSAVSHAIADLESELGFPLLIRNRTGVILTDHGNTIFRYVTNILNLTKSMEQEALAIKGLETGILKIAVIYSVAIKWLPHLIKLFQEKYPNVQFKVLNKQNYNDIENLILSREVDVGFTVLPTKVNLDTISLKQDRMAVIMPKNHPLCNQLPLTIEKIAEYPFIMTRDTWDNLKKTCFRENKVRPTIAHEIDEEQPTLAMVKAGLGITIFPELLLPSTSMEDLHITFLPNKVYRTIGISCLSFEMLSPAAKAFIDITNYWVKENEVNG